MSLPQPLMFTVGLIDQITRPIAKISQGLNNMTANYQAGTMQMASGIGGVAAAGYTLQNALGPAIEMSRALGEVESLGVQSSALKMLAQNSYDYALKYGASATDFVRSAYDIQSAIGGLNDADLSRFTMASNVLAKATKADAATVTSYMGTMYGIFKNDAKNMGEGAWIERLTGMTASAVVAFKTDGKKMADAFGALGASAGLAPLEEQMAIMGTLQATMQGSESATKYKSFLAGVGKAQKALNLQFTDANGNMLPIIDILNKIKGKYGDVISVAEGDALDQAFGSQEATQLIGLLLKDVDGLSSSISKLGKVNGMEQAEKMAASMTNQSDRLAQSWFVIRAALGAAILPAFNQFVSKIADMGASVLWFADTFPNITRWLGYMAIGFLAVVAAGGLLTLMMGAGKMAMTTWSLGAKLCSKSGDMFTAGLARMRGMLLAVNLAMYANPVGLIVAGIAALIAVVGVAVYYFDDLRAMMKGTAWGEPILFAVDAVAGLLKTLGKIAVAVFGAWWEAAKVLWKVLEPVASLLLDVIVFALKAVGVVAAVVFGAMAYTIGGIVNAITWLAEVIYSAFSAAFNIVANAWQSLVAAFSQMEWFTNLLSAASNLGTFFSALWTDIKASFAEFWGWIVEKLNMLPGIDIAVNPVVEQLETQKMQSLIGQPDLMQNAMPEWMQRNAANDSANYVGSRQALSVFKTGALEQPIELQRTLPETYAPPGLKQPIELQRTLPEPFKPAAVQQQLTMQRAVPDQYVPDAIKQQLDVQRNLPEPFKPAAVQQQLTMQRAVPDQYVPDAIKQQLDVQRTLPEPFKPAAVQQQLTMQRAVPDQYVPDVIKQQLDVQRTLPEAFKPDALKQQLTMQRAVPDQYVPDALKQQLTMQRVAPEKYVPDVVKQQIEMQRKMPAVFAPEPISQKLSLQPAANESLSNVITPKVNHQVAMSANANRAASQGATAGKTMQFGDVIIHNPPKNFSLAEIAEQQELLTG